MYELIEHKVLDSTTATVTFSNIPNIYSDLYLVASGRTTYTTTTDSNMRLRFNNDATASYVVAALYATGSNALGFGNTYDHIYGGFVPTALATANTFSSSRIRIADYASSSLTKEISIENVHENNSSTAYMGLIHALWNKTTPITEINIYTNNNPYVQHSSFTLYGVGRKQGIGRAPLAVGGYATYDNGYWIHSFPSSGSFTPFVDMDVEYLVVAGGGGGGWDRAGGGGAGGYRSSVQNELSGRASSPESLLTLSASTNYSVVIGAGGTGGNSGQSQGSNGADSTFATITSIGGGGGGSYGQSTSGGSGGGGFGQFADAGRTIGGAGTAGQGFSGGNGTGYNPYHAAGGGGAGSPGVDATSSGGGNGGDGLPSAITGAIIYRAGGGGGSPDFASSSSVGAGGLGGGGVAGKPPGVGVVNTGSGGGGGGNFPQTNGAAGGSGIVIVRYKA